MKRYFAAAAEIREGIASRQLARTVAECCVFVRALLALLFGEGVVAQARIEDWHLWSMARPWSPVEAAVACGLAAASTYPPAAPALQVGRWHVCQGWAGSAGDLTEGHTWLWYAITETTGIRLDAATQYRPAPGPEAKLTTWAELTARYTGGVAVGVLRAVA